MLSVTLADLSQIIQNGDYFRSLDFINDDFDSENTESILVPENCYWPFSFSPNPIATVDDMAQAIRTTLFWGLDQTPEEIWGAYLALRPTLDELLQKVPDIDKSPVYAELCALDQIDDPRVTSHVPLLSYLIRAKKIEITVALVELAAARGCTDTIRMIFDFPEGWEIKLRKLVWHATNGGHLDCVRFLVDRGHSIDMFDICSACTNGHVACFRYLHEQLTERSKKMGGGGGPHIWDTNAVEGAVIHGHLPCLQYAHEQGYAWRAYSISLAARNGHVDCLRYMRDNGCPWSSNATVQAIVHGQFECIVYLHDAGCPMHDQAVYYAARFNQMACLRYLHGAGFPVTLDDANAAAYNGHLPCLRYLHESGCPWDTTILFESALSGGNVDCVRYMHEQGGTSTMAQEIAASGGHIECLKFLYEHGYQYSRMDAHHAAKHGNLECLQYLEKDWKCEMDYMLMCAAMIQGHLPVITYLHERGCEWRTGGVMIIAAQKGHVKCLQYMHENGCPWTEETLVLAVSTTILISRHELCIHYMRTKMGCGI